MSAPVTSTSNKRSREEVQSEESAKRQKGESGSLEGRSLSPQLEKRLPLDTLSKDSFLLLADFLSLKDNGVIRRLNKRCTRWLTEFPEGGKSPLHMARIAAYGEEKECRRFFNYINASILAKEDHIYPKIAAFLDKKFSLQFYSRRPQAKWPFQTQRTQTPWKRLLEEELAKEGGEEVTNSRFYLGYFHLASISRYASITERTVARTQAFAALRPAAKSGHTKAQYLLGVSLEPGQETIECLKKAAEKGFSAAQCAFGRACIEGRGISPNLKEGIEWLRKSAEQGNPEAQSSLGGYFRKGRGVEQSWAQAVHWFRLAAAQGDPIGENQLGCCFFYGTGGKKNLELAAWWFKQAAEDGNLSGQNNLARCLENGEGVEKDLHQAVTWYRSAATMGHKKAEMNLGACYMRGVGVNVNKKTGARWYLRAAEKGLVEAQWRIAECYLNGEGVEKSHEHAARWFREVALVARKSGAFTSREDD